MSRRSVVPDILPENEPGYRRYVVLGWLGEILMTLGAVALLLCVYQLVWTNVAADRTATSVINDLVTEWEQAPPHPSAVPTQGGSPGSSGPTTATGAVGGAAVAFKPGQGFAILYVPRLGDSFRVPIVEGVELGDLAKGVGHYPGTAMPGAIGNFSVAGHRATHGQPFADMDRIRVGDQFIVQTQNSWYVYTTSETEIVLPTAVQVVLPVPNKPGVKPTQRLATFTTCNPRWASYQRLIVYTELTSTRTATQGPPPQLPAAVVAGT